MNFVTPLTIDVLPVYEDFLAEYKKPFAAKLVFETSMRIYWRTVLTLQQGNKCIWCECEMTHERKQWNSTTIEHMIPRSLGGLDEPENYTVACSRCNNRRGTMSVNNFRSLIRDGLYEHPEMSNTAIRKMGREKKREAASRRALAEKMSKELAVVNAGLTLEERYEANKNRPVTEQYEMLGRALKGDPRTDDKVKALNAVLAGIPNPFDPDTRAWRQYERFARSPRLDNGPKDAIVTL